MAVVANAGHAMTDKPATQASANVSPIAPIRTAATMDAVANAGHAMTDKPATQARANVSPIAQARPAATMGAVTPAVFVKAG